MPTPEERDAMVRQPSEAEEIIAEGRVNWAVNGALRVQLAVLQYFLESGRDIPLHVRDRVDAIMKAEIALIKAGS